MDDDGRQMLDDELAAVIRTAFDQQPLPATPDVTLHGCDSPPDAFVPALKRAKFHRLQFNRLLGSVPVIVASFLLVIAMWPQENRSTVEVESPSNNAMLAEESDEGSEQEIGEVPLPETSDIPPETKLAPTVHESIEKHPVRKAESKPLQLVRLFNDYAIQPPFDSESLTRKGVSILGPESLPVWKGTEMMGIARGVKSVREAVDNELTWIASENEFAFTYQIEKSELMNDLDRFVEGMIGEKIFNLLIDGIRDDPEGPRIDLRKEFIARVKDVIVVVVNRSPRRDGDHVMFVFPVKEVARVSDVLARAAAFEPDVSFEPYCGVPIMVNSRDNPSRSTALVGGCVILGSSDLVRRAIERLSKSLSNDKPSNPSLAK